MAIHIRRRELIVTLGGAAVAWPFTARAQQPAMPMIGFFGASSPDDSAFRVVGFRRGLNEASYLEGQSVTIEWRWAEGHYDRLPRLAADLVHRQVSVIAADGINSALAAKAATSAIPIVSSTGADPVKLGLVANLNRPGGNITGVSILTVGLVAKRLEVLCEAIPNVSTIGLLVNPFQATTELQVREAEDAARSLGRQIVVLNVSTEDDIDTAFDKVVQQRVAAVLAGSDSFITSRSQQLAELAARHRIPAVMEVREFAAAGGLMSYGTSQSDGHRQVGIYTGRILKGGRAADLPVVQSTKVELTINLKAAKALGLTFPITLLGRADEGIE